MLVKPTRLYGCAIFMVLMVEQSRALYCDPGAYYTELDGQEICAPCARGSYSVGGENVTCKGCPRKGKYKVPHVTEGEGATSEDACAIPHCAAGQAYVSLTGHEVGLCAGCRPGAYSVEGTKLKRQEFGWDCTYCEEGSAQRRFRATSCDLCPVGSFSTRRRRAVQCPLCHPGSYQDEEGQSTCKPCGVGQITTIKGRTGCDSCPKGTTTRVNGSSQCLQVCAPGSIGRNGIAPCSPCERGQYVAIERSSQCIQCPEGTTTEKGGATSCDVCAPGYRGKKTRMGHFGRVPCVICAQGTYSEHYRTFCLRCPRGKKTRHEGSTSYDDCV